jgi:hypothetical protein
VIGQKLIGIGQLGKVSTPRGTDVRYWSRFDFTNPDSVARIKIGCISIIRGDGEAIYDGPLLRLERGRSQER